MKKDINNKPPKFIYVIRDATQDQLERFEACLNKFQKSNKKDNMVTNVEQLELWILDKKTNQYTISPLKKDKQNILKRIFNAILNR